MTVLVYKMVNIEPQLNAPGKRKDRAIKKGAAVLLA